MPSARDATASAFAKQKQFNDTIKISLGEADSANGAVKTAKRFSDIFIISHPDRAVKLIYYPEQWAAEVRKRINSHFLSGENSPFFS